MRHYAIPLTLCAIASPMLLRCAQPPETETNRPLREPRKLVLTVGRDEGDLRGTDDTVIQAGIEYLHRVGGGTESGFGIDIQGEVRDVTIRGCRIGNKATSNQKRAVRMGKDARNISLDGNTYTESPVEVEDLRED